MALLTLNGAPVISATIGAPLVGAWTAEVAVDSQEPPTGAVTLQTANGEAVWRGVAHRAGMARGAALVRVIGGAGGLARELAPKAYLAAKGGGGLDVRLVGWRKRRLPKAVPSCADGLRACARRLRRKKGDAVANAI